MGQEQATVIPLDKTGMVQSTSQVGLGFQLENTLLLLKGKPMQKDKKCGHKINEWNFYWQCYACHWIIQYKVRNLLCHRKI